MAVTDDVCDLENLIGELRVIIVNHIGEEDINALVIKKFEDGTFHVTVYQKHNSQSIR